MQYVRIQTQRFFVQYVENGKIFTIFAKSLEKTFKISYNRSIIEFKMQFFEFQGFKNCKKGTENEKVFRSLCGGEVLKDIL